jgi:uncharacterized membrane protein
VVTPSSALVIQAMNRAISTFTIVLVVLALLTLNSMPERPKLIAMHFNAANAPDVWVSRRTYRILVLLSLIGGPLLLVWLMGWMPRLA